MICTLHTCCYIRIDISRQDRTNTSTPYTYHISHINYLLHRIAYNFAKQSNVTFLVESALREKSKSWMEECRRAKGGLNPIRWSKLGGSETDTVWPVYTGNNYDITIIRWTPCRANFIINTSSRWLTSFVGRYMRNLAHTFQHIHIDLRRGFTNIQQQHRCK